MGNEKTPPDNLAQRVNQTRKKGRRDFSSVSLPTPLIEKIEEVIDELGYWPTKTAFVREASLEKLDKHRKEGQGQGR
jgi:metal-responsive CopG/Arc/MetJ family transcriptional regulator